MPLARSFDSAHKPRSIGATSDTGASVDGSAAAAKAPGLDPGVRLPRVSRSSASVTMAIMRS